MQTILLEFTSNNDRKRYFRNGFMRGECPEQPPLTKKMMKYMPGFEWKKRDRRNCDVTITMDTLLVNHDSINNLGHFFQDVMNWWLVSQLIDVPPKSLSLLNIDGLRPGNILQGRGRYLRKDGQPDFIGPFSKILNVLFAGVELLSEYFPDDVSATTNHSSVAKGHVLCFERAHYFPLPLVDFLWGKFEVVDPCSYSMENVSFDVSLQCISMIRSRILAYC